MKVEDIFYLEDSEGRRRSCPFATYGARSALLNDAALGILINITYACSVNDEELFSRPRWGRGPMGCQ